MSTVLGQFPDTEDQLIKGLAAYLGAQSVVRNTTDDLTKTIAAGKTLVRVERIGGPRSSFEDRPLLQIDSFGATRTLGYALSEQIDQFMLATPIRLSAAIIDTVSVSVAPRRVPWDNDNIRRFSASYRATLRRN